MHPILRTLRTRRIVLICVVLLALVGCGDWGDEALPLPYTTIAEGYSAYAGNASTAQVAVATSQAQWATMWARAYAWIQDPPPVPDVDFSTSMTVGIFGPLRGGCGSRIVVVAVLREPHRVSVHYREDFGDRSVPQTCPAVLYHASRIISLPRQDVPVEFVEMP